MEKSSQCPKKFDRINCVVFVSIYDTNEMQAFKVKLMSYASEIMSCFSKSQKSIISLKKQVLRQRRRSLTRGNQSSTVSDLSALSLKS